MLTKMTVNKEIDKDRGIVTYSCAVKASYAVDSGYSNYVENQDRLIPNALIGELLKELNTYNGEYDIVEIDKKSYWNSIDLLQAYIQKYGPLED